MNETLGRGKEMTEAKVKCLERQRKEQKRVQSPREADGGRGMEGNGDTEIYR